MIQASYPLNNSTVPVSCLLSLIPDTGRVQIKRRSRVCSLARKVNLHGEEESECLGAVQVRIDDDDDVRRVDFLVLRMTSGKGNRR